MVLHTRYTYHVPPTFLRFDVDTPAVLHYRSTLLRLTCDSHSRDCHSDSGGPHSIVDGTVPLVIVVTFPERY